MKNKLFFARKNETVILPTKKDENAGYDIYANFEENYIAIPAHKTVLIPTGLYSACSKDYYIQLLERGSTGTKGIAQRCGVIDSGYRGEWFVPITNTTDCLLVISKVKIEALEKELMVPKNLIILYPYEKAICQAAVLPVPKMEVEEISVDEIMNIKSERGTGSLGSSGK